MPTTEYERLVASQKEATEQSGLPQSSTADPETQLDIMADRLRGQVSVSNELAGRLERVVNGLVGMLPATPKGEVPPEIPIAPDTKFDRIRGAINDQDAALTYLNNVVTRFETDL